MGTFKHEFENRTYFIATVTQPNGKPYYQVFTSNLNLASKYTAQRVRKDLIK